MRGAAAAVLAAASARGGGAFRVSLPASNGRVLSASGPGGRLELVAPAAAGDTARFTFEAADGCAVYPEVEVNQAAGVIGAPPG